MKEITSYECSDGRVFKDRSEAARHDATIELEAWAVREGICSGGDWSALMVIDTMIEHVDELLVILSDVSTNHRILLKLGKMS